MQDKSYTTSGPGVHLVGIFNLIVAIPGPLICPNSKIKVDLKMKCVVAEPGDIT